MARKPMMKSLIALALMALVAYAYLGVTMKLSHYDSAFEAQVRRGSTLRQAAKALAEQGLVKSEPLFMLVGYATGLHKHLRAGYYAFEAGDYSLWDICNALRAGKIIERTVLIVEGETLDDIKGRLQAAGLINASEFDRIVRSTSFKTANRIDAPTAEGYLFPDTYTFAKGVAPGELLGYMVRHMREKLTPAMLQSARAFSGLDERGVLTLASIVEKEARVDRDRAMVAAVYLNRIRARMPLQADPTAVYGVKPMREGVKAADLHNRTPYNTYLINGLPPGPIASPGLKAIEAVVSPAKGPWLYFVADGVTGGHIFSANEKEHQRAVAAYRKAMKRSKK